jgi:hypothetical protein
MRPAYQMARSRVRWMAIGRTFKRIFMDHALARQLKDAGYPQAAGERVTLKKAAAISSRRAHRGL